MPSSAEIDGKSPMLIVSFCIPVYNRADRIRRCIESLIAQTASNDDYEIIVVDDCSTDGTAKVVQDIFDEHGISNGRVHTLKKNSGSASAPRNAAAKLARGKYLFFVDSDDYVVPELVDKIRAFASEFDSDIIYPRYRRETEAGVATSKPHAFARRGDLGQADVVRHQMLQAMSVLKAFKRSEWERLGIAFDPTLRTGEDILVVAKFLFNTTRHSVIADKDYYVIVDHEAARLTQKPTPRAATFRNYGDILDIIYAGSLGDLRYRYRAAAMFINRIMRVGAGANNAYLASSVSAKSQSEWRGLFSDLLTSHFPLEADAYVAPQFRAKVGFLRVGDLVGARFAVAFHELKGSPESEYQERLMDIAGPRTGELLRHVRASASVSAAVSQGGLDLEAVYSSLSWRVTGPLRASARLAKQIAPLVRRPRSALRQLVALRHPKHTIAGLRLDEDGRPEVVLGLVGSMEEVAVFAMVSPRGHRDARHRLPLREAGAGMVAARLPVPGAPGELFARLSVQSGGEVRPLGIARRRQRVESPELRAVVTATRVRIERTAPATPWRPIDTEETGR